MLRKKAVKAGMNGVACVCVGGWWGGRSKQREETDRQTKTDTKRETETDRERERQTDRQRD